MSHGSTSGAAVTGVHCAALEALDARDDDEPTREDDEDAMIDDEDTTIDDEDWTLDDPRDALLERTDEEAALDEECVITERLLDEDAPAGSPASVEESTG